MTSASTRCACFSTTVRPPYAAAQRMVGIAQQAKVPVVGVTETEPAGITFRDWVIGELNAIAQALSNPS
jgi:zinc/manganese transport system substrate-binding protein